MMKPEADDFDQETFNDLMDRASQEAFEGRFLESLKVCHGMEELNPQGDINRGMVLYMVGRLNAALGNELEALRSLERAVSIMPGSRNAFVRLSRMYYKLGMPWKVPLLKINMIRSIPAMYTEWKRQDALGIDRPLSEWFILPSDFRKS